MKLRPAVLLAGGPIARHSGGIVQLDKRRVSGVSSCPLRLSSRCGTRLCPSADSLVRQWWNPLIASDCVDFWAEIAPLVESRCIGCHRPGVDVA